MACGTESFERIARLLTGTDENSLKNVLAAASAGVGVRPFVEANAAAFLGLHESLGIAVDEVVRTSADHAHADVVARLWRACSADLYRRHYSGLYCVGCEQFSVPSELVGGACREHGPVTEVAEENWFFRLSAYAERVRALIASGELRVHPAQRRNEVLGLLADVPDLSVSRSAARARGWGIPVPGDPGQVVYVWFDALAGYLAGERWFAADRRIHLVGKGVVRFHAIYWPAILLAAGLPLPTDIVVHDYLTADGRKISKSAGGSAGRFAGGSAGRIAGSSADTSAGGSAGTFAGGSADTSARSSAATFAGGSADPTALAARYGADALRWWLLREVAPVGDTDFTVARLVARADADLANGLGNLVQRVVSLARRRGRVPGGHPLADPGPTIDAALAEFDFRAATGAVVAAVDAANRHVEATAPWRCSGAEFDAAVGPVLATCRVIADRLGPFLPVAAARVRAAVTPVGGRLPAPAPVFTRLSLPPGGE